MPSEQYPSQSLPRGLQALDDKVKVAHLLEQQLDALQAQNALLAKKARNGA